MSSDWVNSDGLTVRFGKRVSENRKQGKLAESGSENTAIVDFDYESAAATGVDGINAAAGADGQRVPIPAGAVIRDVQLKVLTGFAGAGFTGLNVGTEQADGTDIDADGFFAVAGQGAAANLTAAGTVVGETTEINTQLSATEPAYVLVAVGGTAPTAGSAQLVVRYS